MATDSGASETKRADSAFRLSSAQKERYARLGRQFRHNTKAMVGLAVVLTLVVVALFAPLIAPYSVSATSIDDRSEGPSLEHPFGTDELGRDIFSRVVLGSRISLDVGFGSIVGALAVGTTIGVVSGYAGGMVDEVLMRVMDAAMAFPPILLALTVMVVHRPRRAVGSAVRTQRGVR
jgi:ABC-type dipeptide/oligopeptide/nickel transport system permease subunit